VPISFIIAILPGPPGMASAAATDLPMFSPVHAIIAADAGLIANTKAIVAVANRAFILFSPSAAECRFDNDNQWARFRRCQGHHWSNPVNPVFAAFKTKPAGVNRRAWLCMCPEMEAGYEYFRTTNEGLVRLI
jgi:hypothetical protein